MTDLATVGALPRGARRGFFGAGRLGRRGSAGIVLELFLVFSVEAASLVLLEAVQFSFNSVVRFVTMYSPLLAGVSVIPSRIMTIQVGNARRPYCVDTVCV